MTPTPTRAEAPVISISHAPGAIISTNAHVISNGNSRAAAEKVFKGMRVATGQMGLCGVFEYLSLFILVAFVCACL